MRKFLIISACVFSFLATTAIAEEAESEKDYNSYDYQYSNDDYQSEPEYSNDSSDYSYSYDNGEPAEDCLDSKENGDNTEDCISSEEKN